MTLAQPSATRATSSFHEVYRDLLLPLDVSYEADVWARVRNSVNASVAATQATAADVETVALSLHAELAIDYFTLRGLDRVRELLDTSVQAYERALELTRNRFEGGIASQADVAFAETQLESTRAQAIDMEASRATLEHAIAVLVGRPAGLFAIDRSPDDLNPPVVPVGVPSDLLERRPDIASVERRVAAANAQVGVATSALYPVLTLSGAAGFEASSFGQWLSTASHFWSITPAMVVNVFDAGRRRSGVDQATAAYDQTTAVYRASVLSAFREVEDQLAALRVLEDEEAVQARAGRCGGAFGDARHEPVSRRYRQLSRGDSGAERGAREPARGAGRAHPPDDGHRAADEGARRRLAGVAHPAARRPHTVAIFTKSRRPNLRAFVAQDARRVSFGRDQRFCGLPTSIVDVKPVVPLCEKE